MVKITFAIPFFRGLGFLKEAMASVKGQNSPLWTCVILDDSTDPAETAGAAALAAEFGFKIRRNPGNLGMALNWNQALALEGAELVTLLHSDDRLEPDYTGKVLESAARHPGATAFFCRTRIIGESGKGVFSFPDFYKGFLLPGIEHGEIRLAGPASIAKLVPGNFIFCPTLCYRPALLGALRFDPALKMVLDLDLIFRMLLRGDTLIGLYEKPLYQYRRHRENATVLMTRSLIRFEEEVALYRSIAQKLEDRGETSIANEARKLSVIRKNLWFQMMLSIARFDLNGFRNYSGFRTNLDRGA